MKLSVLQENLAQGLNTASRLVAPKAQLPVLGNILLATDRGRLKLSATNLETGINLWLGAKIDQEGSISIPAKIFTEYIVSLRPGKINLEVKENTLTVKGEFYQANFIGIPASEFPSIPTLKEEPKIKLGAKEIVSAVSQVAFAASQDDSRPVLSGILIRVKDNTLSFVATDGYRLSLRHLKEGQELVKAEELQSGILVPARTLTEVAKAINIEDDKAVLGLTITSQAKQVIFSLPDIELISRLVEGKFPDYEKIIPDHQSSKIIFDTETFLAAVRTAAVFARESANIIRFAIGRNKVSLSANAAQVGDNLYDLEAKTEGEEAKIAFNSRYLLDFLNSVDSDIVEMTMTTSLNPGVFSPAGRKDYLHIIMPVRVQE